MAKVDVLIKGYNREINSGLHNYACTCTLIRDKDINMVVDPGSHQSIGMYIFALGEFGLALEDINFVFTTHEHLDHSMNRALFENATIIDRYGYHKGDEHRFHSNDEEFEISKDIKMIATPGHGGDIHASLLVETHDGTVCVAGDVWWYEDLTPEIDPHATSQEELEVSRQKLIKVADYIIPGHGGIVRNNRKDE